jgi:nicotinate-nucleotide--dimethylbenzimidazole phosphoribosyltransferase
VGAGPLPVSHRAATGEHPPRPAIPIRPVDGAARAAAARQAQLVQPPGRLGRLEELAVWLAGVSGDERPEVRARVVVAAADHGVVARGVPADPQAVTAPMLATLLAGHGAVAVLARELGASLVCVDAGLAADTTALDVVRTGLRPSRDLTLEPALDVGEVALAVDTGRELAAQAARDGVTVLVGAEMGSAATIPATCLAALLTGREPGALVGPATGPDTDGMRREATVVERALALHGTAARGPLGALRRVGGGEIAVLCGLALGAGEHGLGYVCDGLVATAAAAVAAAIEPDLLPRLLAGHRSTQPGHRALLEHLGLEPVLDLGMRLGEGSGALAAVALLRLAAAAHAGTATLAEAAGAGEAAEAAPAEAAPAEAAPRG